METDKLPISDSCTVQLDASVRAGSPVQTNEQMGARTDSRNL